MRKVTLIRTLPVLLSLLLSGGMLMAQSARSSIETQAAIKKSPQVEQQVVEAKAAKLEAARSAKAGDRAAVVALAQELKQNAANERYDVDATFQQLRRSPWVIYPFDHFDPNFPIVIRTGDKAVDDAAYAAAKRAWRAAQ